MNISKVRREHRKLKAYVDKAQYDYNLLVDDQWAAKDLSHLGQDAIQEAFDLAEKRLFKFEKVLHDFERDNAKALAKVEA